MFNDTSLYVIPAKPLLPHLGPQEFFNQKTFFLSLYPTNAIAWPPTSSYPSLTV
jgi:hypothetical protein